MPLKLQASMRADVDILRLFSKRFSRTLKEILMEVGPFYWNHFETAVHGWCYFEWKRCCKIFMGCGESRMYLLGKCSVECIGCLGVFEGSLISVGHLSSPTDVDWKKFLSTFPPLTSSTSRS